MTDHLPAALRALWHELPLVAAAGVLICTASGLAVLLMPGVLPGSVLLSALLVGPVWAAVVATTDSVVRDGRGGVLLMLRNVRRCGLAGLEVAVVPAVITALALLNWSLTTGPLSRGLLFAVPLAVSGCACVLAVLASCYAFSLRVTARLRGKALWLTALTLVARAPMVPLGVLALAFVAMTLGTSVTASLLLLAPGPVALFASAGSWSVYRTESHALHR